MLGQSSRRAVSLNVVHLSLKQRLLQLRLPQIHHVTMSILECCDHRSGTQPTEPQPKPPARLGSEPVALRVFDKCSPTKLRPSSSGSYLLEGSLSTYIFCPSAA